MPKKILVFQHAPHEGLGSLEDELKKQNLSWDTMMVCNNLIFPSGDKLEEYSALIIPGGPMGVYEEGKYPWIRKEILVIQEALRQKKPILGICLGAQMLAKAAGGRVYRGNKKEIGWYPVRLDDWFFKRNPLFFQINPTKPHMVFQWHGDTFDIPIDGYRLVWGGNYPNQAFSVNGNAVGLQFHVEMTDEMIRKWLSGEGIRPRLLKEGFDPDQILAESSQYLPLLREMAHKIFYGFSSLIRENVRRAA